MKPHVETALIVIVLSLAIIFVLTLLLWRFH